MRLCFVMHCIVALDVATAQSNAQGGCQDKRLLALQNEFNVFNYGQGELQRAATLENNRDGKYWAVFLHGGAWQAGAGVNFLCAVDKMRSTKGFPIDQIRGFATTDYRLSGQQNQGRNQKSAQHPDHVQDARSAIQSFAQTNQLDKYILIGHSAGGTMAFQLLMDEDEAALQNPGSKRGPKLKTRRAARESAAAQIPLPDAIISTAGIFDLRLLVDEANDQFYTEFVIQAFGREKKAWDQASPAKFNGSFKQMWPGDNVVVLARSQQDTLVNISQLEAMEQKLTADGIRPVVMGNLTGEHDVVWEQGDQLAGLVQQTISLLDK